MAVSALSPGTAPAVPSPSFPTLAPAPAPAVSLDRVTPSRSPGALSQVQGETAGQITGEPVNGARGSLRASAAGGVGAFQTGGAMLNMVLGPLAIQGGLNDVAKGAQQIAEGDVLRGTLEAGSGAGSVAGGTAATIGAVATLLGETSVAVAAAPVAAAGAGVAAVLDGANQVIHNWDDRTQDNQTGAGLIKTGAGTAMLVGAALMATGVGAPLGAAIALGGGIVSGVTYLAENTEIGRTVTEAVGGAAHWVADTAVSAATTVGTAVSDAWSWATSWL